MSTAKFPLGRVVGTPGVIAKISRVEITVALRRHHTGDWGDVCREDHRANEEALEHGFRLFSVYHTQAGEKFWIITEADRSATTVLFPHEY